MWRIPPLLISTRAGANTKKMSTMCGYLHRAEAHQLPHLPPLPHQVRQRQPRRRLHLLLPQQLLQRLRQQQHLPLQRRLRPGLRQHRDHNLRRDRGPLRVQGCSQTGSTSRQTMPDGRPKRAKQAAKPPLLTQRVAENAFHHRRRKSACQYCYRIFTDKSRHNRCSELRGTGLRAAPDQRLGDRFAGATLHTSNGTT
jgi:hypothetical protein